MKNRLPRPRELAIFLSMAVVCTLIVAATGKYDVALGVLGAPVFLVAAMMGHRRSEAVAGKSIPLAAAATDGAPVVTPPAAGDAAS